MPGRSAWPASLVLVAGVGALALLGLSRETLPASLAAYSAAFLALLHLWRRHPSVLDDPRVLLGGAVLLRLTLFPSLGDLSDDLYRYVWDGWLAASGVNPFRFIPADPALAPFQDSPLFGNLNSPEFHSIYPPLSQLVFLPGGALYERLGWPAAAYAVKGGFLTLEMLGIVCLYLALRGLGRRPGVLSLYALNPLAVVAVAGSGHTEGGLVLGMGLLAWGVAAGAPARAWVGLVLAGASKGIPLLLAPLLIRRHVGQVGLRRALAAALPAGILGIALLAPYLFPGIVAALSSSADLYVRLFEFNAGLYYLIREGMRWITGEDWGAWIGPALRLFFLAAAILVWTRSSVQRTEDWFRASLLVVTLYLVTATTVHPWYLLWGLPFVPFTPFLRGAWVWTSWAAFLTYFTYTGTAHGLLAGIFWGGAALFALAYLEPGIRDHLLRWAGRRKARQIRGQLVGARILDLGAGEGYVAAALREPGRFLLLMDIGPHFRVALPAVVYDGARIPLSDDSVDTVLISLVLHHTEAPDGVVAEALRVARQRVIVTESTYEWEWERRLVTMLDRWANRGRGMDERDRGAPLPRFRRVPEWEATFRDRGGYVTLSTRLNRVGHRHHLFVIEPSGSRASIDA